MDIKYKGKYRFYSVSVLFNVVKKKNKKFNTFLKYIITQISGPYV